jgi:predicted nucleic acid-binding protein
MAEICVLLDANVILDVLARREPHLADSAGVWALVESGAVRGLVAAHSATTIHYLISRHTSRKVAAAAIGDLLSVFGVAAIDQTILLQALALGWPDYEDAVQACAGAQAGAHYLVTRDPGNYRAAPLPVLTPHDFLSSLRAL